MALPDCDTLFHRYFFPWYSEEDRERRGYEATRPDIEHLEASAELVASDLSPLTEESQAMSAERIRDMFEAAVEDWKQLLAVKGSPSTVWIAEFDRRFNSRQIQRLIKRSDPQQYDNDYLVICCELGSVLGTVLQTLEPELSWIYEWPYWDSSLYDRGTRARINVFDWAIKKMSSYGMDDGMTSKLQACRTILHDPN